MDSTDMIEIPIMNLPNQNPLLMNDDPQQLPLQLNYDQFQLIPDQVMVPRIVNPNLDPEAIELVRLMQELEEKYSPNNTQVAEFDFYLKPLGWGVSAIVYKIQWSDGSLGAMKEFKVKNTTNQDKLLRTIHHELDILGRLNHPNIINPLGVDWERIKPKVFFPYYESSLTSFAKNHKEPLLEENIKLWTKLAQQLLAAVNHMHHNNIVHGDIKPDNIMIEPMGPQLVLCDFGSAIDTTQTNNKPMSGLSEQWANKFLSLSGVPSQGSDLYAVGLTLYWLFSRKNPWAETHPLVLIQGGQKPLLDFPLPSSFEKLIESLLQACDLEATRIFDAQYSLLDNLFATNPGLAVFKPQPIGEFPNPQVFHTNFSRRDFIDDLEDGDGDDELHDMNDVDFSPGPKLDPIWQLFADGPEEVSPIAKLNNNDVY